ncbi:c-type cytochrome [Methylotuvimicrobium buryatense]|uniref:Cytochrome c4 n=1 Tax=Methylotuvimicrobium buryatense TaxID=95641 RepID=A0A4P9UM51_METBY|nr:c-type cytochrome [Methylotuvimicrobium buryatense]QCW82379.1 cytochrome c4 [Methylotuvimicrobium buryatense]
MNKMVVAALTGLLVSTAAQAEPASKVAWTPEQLNFVKKGSAAKGKELSATCTGCHGEQGVSQVPNYPSLAGQLATYTYKQLQDYKTGHRKHELMGSMVTGLSNQDMADLAVWFSTLPTPKPQGSRQSLAKAEFLVKKGDGKRTLPPCAVCHGVEGKGEKMDIPALAGQQADYFVQTLEAYQKDERRNDIFGRMRILSKQLTAEEIKELAQYYQAK